MNIKYLINMPPKQTLAMKTSANNKTDLIPIKRCYQCQERLEFRFFDYKDKSIGKLWGACIECRKVKELDKKKRNRESSINLGSLTCTKCKGNKTLDAFTPKKHTGYYVQCTQCRTALGK